MVVMMAWEGDGEDNRGDGVDSKGGEAVVWNRGSVEGMVRRFITGNF